MIETPQTSLMRVACGLAETPEEAIRLYDTFSNSITSRAHRPCSTPAPCTHSCRVASRWTRLRTRWIRSMIATKRWRLSKHGGGIGIAFHRVRAAGSLIRGTNGLSNGIVPWLKTLDSSVAAVNQGGRRKGACCIYLEPWHGDIEAFLDLRENTGDEAPDL